MSSELLRAYIYVCSELVARSTVEYIGLADSLENHTTLHHTLLLIVIGHARRLFLHVLPIPTSQRRRAIPSVYDGTGLHRSLAVASAPYDAVGSATHSRLQKNPPPPYKKE